MAQGIRLPLRTSNGRLELLGGDDYIEQLVFTALGDGDSENPFQDLGLGEFMIFGINDRLTDGEIRDRVLRVFEFLEADQLARIANPQADLVFEEDRGAMGVEARLVLMYTNMETQERRELTVPIPPASGS